MPFTSSTLSLFQPSIPVVYLCAYDQCGHRCSAHSCAAGIGSSAAYYSGGHDRPGGCTCQCWPTAQLRHLSVATDCRLLLGTAPEIYTTTAYTSL